MPAATALSRSTGQRGARATQAVAHAVGWDAGNSAMRAAGRTAWNEDDWDAACDAFDRLMRLADSAAAPTAATAAPKRRALRAA
jgi:hypothetical protein